MPEQLCVKIQLGLSNMRLILFICFCSVNLSHFTYVSYRRRSPARKTMARPGTLIALVYTLLWDCVIYPRRPAHTVTREPVLRIH